MTERTSPIDLAGRRILITGAAGGIGSATAKLCAAQGADLVLVDVLDARAIAERAVSPSTRAEIRICDTSQRDAVLELAVAIGPIYGLVDCAAICPAEDWMDDGFDAAFDRTIAVNVKGPLNLTRTFFPGMAERGEGRIVLCGSVAGWMGGLRSGPHYAFTKGGVHAFVRWLARRAASHDVLVNAIAPGPVDTGMTAGRGYEPKTYPLKRMAQPEEIAAMALFLCGPGASYISGAVFDVNGATHYR